MSFTVTVAQFRTQFADDATLLSSSDAQIQRALDEALLIHRVQPLATLFCAAHIRTLDKAAADGKTTSPEVSQRRAGPLSATYLTQAEENREAFFTSTSYGKRFLNLEKRSARAGIGAMVV